MGDEPSLHQNVCTAIVVPKVGYEIVSLKDHTSLEEGLKVPSEYAYSCVETSPANCLRYTLGGTFKILVGPEKIEFEVHKDLFTSHSPFFQACLNKDFKEGNTNEVCLPEDDPDAIGILIESAYGMEEFNNRRSFQMAYADDYFHAYVLADKYLMIRCKNLIMDQIRRLFVANNIDACHVAQISQLKLDQDSPLYRFLIEEYAWDLTEDPNSYIDGWTSIEKDFFTDPGIVSEIIWQILAILKSDLRIKTAGMNPAAVIGCAYHDHSDGDLGACGALGITRWEGSDRDGPGRMWEPKEILD